MHNNFESDNIDMEMHVARPEYEIWDRTSIWANFPELSYNEFMETESGLSTWLDMFYKVSKAIEEDFYKRWSFLYHSD